MKNFNRTTQEREIVFTFDKEVLVNLYSKNGQTETDFYTKIRFYLDKERNKWRVILTNDDGAMCSADTDDLEDVKIDIKHLEGFVK